MAGAATSAASESSAHDTDAAMMEIERGDALFMLAGLAWCPRLHLQVSLRVDRHACTHESLTHHTAWTACSPHVLAGRSKAVEFTYNGFPWLYKSWAVGVGGGTRCGAMVCVGLLRVSTESDRQIDLS